MQKTVATWTPLTNSSMRRKLENSAYRAFAAEYKAADQWHKDGTVEASEKLDQAKAKSLRRVQTHDAFAEYSSWVTDAFQIVDLPGGEIRDRETNERTFKEGKRAGHSPFEILGIDLGEKD